MSDIYSVDEDMSSKDEQAIRDELKKREQAVKDAINTQTLKDGRELDALVAREVFGYPEFAPQILHLIGRHTFDAGRVGCLACGRRDDTTECLPRYSTDIAAAWTVVEWLVENKGWSAGNFVLLCEGNEWNATYTYTGDDGGDEIDWTGGGRAETAPHAICLAALAAVRAGASA